MLSFEPNGAPVQGAPFCLPRVDRSTVNTALSIGETDMNMRNFLFPANGNTPLTTLIRLNDETNTWLWHASLVNELLINKQVNLEEIGIKGLMSFPGDSPTQALIYLTLQSQMIFSLLYTDANGENTCMTDPIAPLILSKCPVLLGSTLIRPDGEIVFGSKRPYPPTEHGTAAAVSDLNNKWRYYSITELPEEAQQRQKQISRILDELSEQFQRQSDSTTFLIPFPSLTTSSTTTDVWPRELQTMIWQLAQNYYEFHKHDQAIQNTTETKNKPIPSIANVFSGGRAEIPTHQPFQVWAHATIAKPDEWQEEPTQKENELILSLRRVKPSGIGYAQIRADITGKARETVLANMWEQIKGLSDLDSDVYLAMVAQMLRGVKDGKGNTWISAQQILDYRGIKPKINKTDSGATYIGGHRQEDIEEIAACFRRMENVWIKISEQEIIDDTALGNKRRRPRKTISRESRLFMFGDVIYHNQLPLDGKPSNSIPIAWQFRESSWMLPFLEGSNRFTGIIFQKVLNYDPYHEKWEKRLSKHFTLWLRTNASREKKPVITITDLFNELNLEIDERNPQRTRDHFDKAMNKIQTDGILMWSYKDKIDLPSRKWLPTWLQQQIIVEDPPMVKDQYLSIKVAAKVVRAEQRVIRQGQRKKARSKDEK